MTNLREASARLVECLKAPSRLKRGETLRILADRVQAAIDGEARQSKELRRLNGPGGDGLIVLHRIRGGGKTTELIERVKKENGILLLKWAHHAEQIIVTGQLSESQVMTWDEARDPQSWRGRERRGPVYVDEAGAALQAYFPECRLTGISIS